ncbi:uncharacterized protein LOC106062788 [Biomphalaria glabrata]|uniref:Uncharacterized protein LOC106062788 n=1 Tax=Biomphalaria glabrata TaxID=6526 RepID=A0A9U8E7J5_BIOGL|nr:uncharacterized protein LOC106062788 [Biomphalaria glabrata]
MYRWSLVLSILISLTPLKTSADLSSLIRNYSPACQAAMFNNPDVFQKINMGTLCSQETSSWITKNFVKPGLCTETEMNNLSSAICGRGSSQVNVTSPAKRSYFAGLSYLSSICQAKVDICLKQSVISVILKQQEQYCTLMNFQVNGINFEACLNSEPQNCTEAEISSLKSAACQVTTTDVNQTLSIALLKSSPTCLAQVSNCADSNQTAREYFLNEKFCKAFTVLENVSSTAPCKTNNYCSAADLDLLRTAACASSKPTNSTPPKIYLLPSAIQVIKTFTSACQLMFSQSVYMNMTAKTYCSQEGLKVLAQYLVRMGFCTENEHNTLTETVCNRSRPYTQLTISRARSNFYAALNSQSYQCQAKLHSCLKSNSASVVLKQQEQFCSLLNLDMKGTTSEMCITHGTQSCTKSEFDQLKSAACEVTATDVDQTFSDALLKTSMKCQAQVSSCVDSNENATQLVVFENYCAALNATTGPRVAACKAVNVCTSAEMNLLRAAACEPDTLLSSASFRPVSVVYVALVVLLCWSIKL